MTNPVMILTDSSVNLPADLVARYPIRVIPLKLNLNGVWYLDGVEIQTSGFFQRLSTANRIETTNQIGS